MYSPFQYFFWKLCTRTPPLAYIEFMMRMKTRRCISHSSSTNTMLSLADRKKKRRPTVHNPAGAHACKYIQICRTILIVGSHCRAAAVIDRYPHTSLI
ncbi:unnamed protein product [Diplocarpon coronariae]